jgi:hypothetical protein
MSVRPNFTGVERRGDKVRVSGVSDDDFADIVDIQVVLTQGNQIVRKVVQDRGSVWVVEFDSKDFVAGPVMVFGWETRKENFTTISWAAAFEIPEAEGEP